MYNGPNENHHFTFFLSFYEYGLKIAQSEITIYTNYSVGRWLHFGEIGGSTPVNCTLPG